MRVAAVSARLLTGGGTVSELGHCVFALKIIRPAITPEGLPPFSLMAQEEGVIRSRAEGQLLVLVSRLIFRAGAIL